LPRRGAALTFLIVPARALYVVDTDASVREGLSRLATSAGFAPQPFACAETFIGEARAGNAACALLDLSDAGLRKPEVRARVSVVASWLPMIALSARDDAQTRAMARELGARAFFRKPVDAAALLDSIAWVSRLR
jgi:FixJ family two-component response regulator